MRSLMGCLCGVRRVTIPEYSTTTLIGFFNYMLSNRDLSSTPMVATWIFICACLIIIFPNALSSAVKMGQLYRTRILSAVIAWFTFWYVWPMLMHWIAVFLIDYLQAPAITWHGVSLLIVVLGVIACLASVSHTYRLSISVQPTTGLSRRRPGSADSLSLSSNNSTCLPEKSRFANNINSGNANSSVTNMKRKHTVRVYPSLTNTSTQKEHVTPPRRTTATTISSHHNTSARVTPPRRTLATTGECPA